MKPAFTSILLLVSVVFFFSTSSATAASPAAEVWLTDCVLCPKTIQEIHNQAMAVEPDGDMHLAYGGDHLYHAWQENGVWQKETVDFAPQTGSYASLALDNAGNVHISYRDGLDNSLRYAVKHDGAWVTETVELGDEYWTIDHSAVLVSTSGEVWLIYSRGGYDGTYVKAAHRNGFSGPWIIETPYASNLLVLCNLSAALDTNGTPHIAIYNCYRFAAQAMYIWWNGIGWRYENIEGVGHGGKFISIALDPLNQPYVSYISEWSGSALRFGHRVNGAWQMENIDNYASFSNDLSVNAAGVPYIAYFHDFPTNLKGLVVTHWNGSSWQPQRVDAQGRDAVNIAFDDSQNVHLSYLRLSPDSIHSKEFRTGSYVNGRYNTELLEIFSDVSYGEENHLSFDSDGNPWIGYRISYQIWLSHWQGKNWKSEYLAGKTSLIGPDIDFTLDRLNHPHFLYSEKLEDCNATFAIIHHFWNGLVWIKETVVSGLGDKGCGNQSTPVSMTLDNANNLHFTYFDNRDANLHYRFWDGSVWVDRIIQSIPDGPRVSKLVLDVSGEPNILFLKAGELTHARWAETQWEFASISSATLPFHFILDNAGNPYILFSHRTWSGLNWTEEIIFAEKGASTWTQTQLAQYPMAVFQGMSLTRDSKGNFHAFVSGEQQIIHFTRQAGTWTQETIENNSQTEYLSADITPADVKGLSYYDQFTNDLKYMSDTPLLEMDIAAQPAENLNNNDLVTITITLNNTGLDEVLICQLPNALRYEANSLSGTISPSAVYNPSTQTITWNGTIGAGKPTIQFQARLVQSPDPPVIHINLQHPSTARQISRDFLLPKRWIYLPLILFNRLEE